MNSEQINMLLENVVKPIYKIEEDIGIPKNVLQQSKKGKRNLPKKWSLLLKDYVDKKKYLLSSNKSEANVDKADLNKKGAYLSEAIKKKMGIK